MYSEYRSVGCNRVQYGLHQSKSQKAMTEDKVRGQCYFFLGSHYIITLFQWVEEEAKQTEKVWHTKRQHFQPNSPDIWCQQIHLTYNLQHEMDSVTSSGRVYKSLYFRTIKLSLRPVIKHVWKQINIETWASL